MGPPQTPLFARLHIEPVGGVAGDMLLGALLDLGADVSRIEQVFGALHIDGLELRTEWVTVNNERACYVRSIVPERDAHHQHTHLDDILNILERAELSELARSRARQIFGILVAAECAVHGGNPDDVALHEVGELDSIMDVIGISVALDLLGNPEISANPLPSGRGYVDTQHGVLSCPVPAVVEIARQYNVPLLDTDISGETVTPTGIAVLAQVCKTYGATQIAGAPRRGVGAGSRRFPDRPNVVRVYGWP